MLQSQARDRLIFRIKNDRTMAQTAGSSIFPKGVA
jgi:hypothetical protein